jgi:hypothetical protein
MTTSVEFGFLGSVLQGSASPTHRPFAPVPRCLVIGFIDILSEVPDHGRSRVGLRVCSGPQGGEPGCRV